MSSRRTRPASAKIQRTHREVHDYVPSHSSDDSLQRLQQRLRAEFEEELRRQHRSIRTLTAQLEAYGHRAEQRERLLERDLAEYKRRCALLEDQLDLPEDLRGGAGSKGNLGEKKKNGKKRTVPTRCAGSQTTTSSLELCGLSSSPGRTTTLRHPSQVADPHCAAPNPSALVPPLPGLAVPQKPLQTTPTAQAQAHTHNPENRAAVQKAVCRMEVSMQRMCSEIIRSLDYLRSNSDPAAQSLKTVLIESLETVCTEVVRFLGEVGKLRSATSIPSTPPPEVMSARSDIFPGIDALTAATNVSFPNTFAPQGAHVPSSVPHAPQGHPADTSSIRSTPSAADQRVGQGAPLSSSNPDPNLDLPLTESAPSAARTPSPVQPPPSAAQPPTPPLRPPTVSGLPAPNSPVLESSGVQKEINQGESLAAGGVVGSQGDSNTMDVSQATTPAAEVSKVPSPRSILDNDDDDENYDDDVDIDGDGRVSDAATPVSSSFDGGVSGEISPVKKEVADGGVSLGRSSGGVREVKEIDEAKTLSSLSGSSIASNVASDDGVIDEAPAPTVDDDEDIF